MKNIVNWSKFESFLRSSKLPAVGAPHSEVVLSDRMMVSANSISRRDIWNRARRFSNCARPKKTKERRVGSRGGRSRGEARDTPEDTPLPGGATILDGDEESTVDDFGDTADRLENRQVSNDTQLLTSESGVKGTSDPAITSGGALESTITDNDEKCAETSVKVEINAIATVFVAAKTSQEAVVTDAKKRRGAASIFSDLEAYCMWLVLSHTCARLREIDRVFVYGCGCGMCV